MRDEVHVPRTAPVRHAQIFLFADGEINFDRTYLRHRGEHGRRSHQVAHLHGVDAGDSVDQGSDLGVAEVYRGLFYSSLVGLDGGLRCEQRLSVGIQLALGNGMSLGFGNITLYVQLGVRHLRLSLRQLSFGLVKHGVEWTRIDLKQELAFFDKCPFAIILANQVTGHLRLNLRIDVPVESSYPLALEGHIFLEDRRYFDHRRWRRGRSAHVTVAAAQPSQQKHRTH